MKIALVGAFDRNNYGDILMPIVLEKRLRKEIIDTNLEFFYYGLQESNMEMVKGVNTKALKEIYEDKIEFDAIIVVGGEVLTSRYTNMYLNLQKNRIIIFTLSHLAKFFKNSIENYCSKKLNGKEERPWIIDKDKVKCKFLIYNTVGGKKLEKIEKVKKNIKKFDYISLREQGTYKVIKEINKNAKLYPDSVVSLSYVITEDEINENVRDELKKDINNLGDYFVFQVKRKVGEEYVNDIIGQIEEIYNRLGIGCVLLPIGYAQGHEDQMVLKKIYNKLKTKSILINDNNIFETIYVIKNSKLYVGTSLHGAITSISYNVPHMALTDKIPKLLDFLKTWNTTPIVYTNPDSIYNNLEILLNNSNTQILLKNARITLFKESDKNFQEIKNILMDIQE